MPPPMFGSGPTWRTRGSEVPGSGIADVPDPGQVGGWRAPAAPIAVDDPAPGADRERPRLSRAATAQMGRPQAGPRQVEGNDPECAQGRGGKAARPLGPPRVLDSVAGDQVGPGADPLAHPRVLVGAGGGHDA